MNKSFGECVALAASELKFWQGFVQTARFLDGWCADIKTPELQDEVFNYVKARPRARVLDVGSGVCSILFGTVPNNLLVAADPMSPLYALIFPYHKYPFQAPEPYTAEELMDVKAAGHGLETEGFDIVHISNALDHSQDPEKAFMSLLACVKLGGSLIVCGFVDEGNAQHLQGMHKYNLRVSSESHWNKGSDDLVMEDATSKEQIGRHEGKLLVQKKLGDRTWFAWVHVK